MPSALPGARAAGRAGAGNGSGAWHRETALAPQPRVGLWLQEPAGDGKVLLGEDCGTSFLWNSGLGLLLLSFISSSSGSKGQENRGMSSLLPACTRTGEKGEEGAVLF